MRTVNQKGFSVIEGLLILVVVGILGFTGWYVCHAKQTSDKSYSTANNSMAPTYKKKTNTKTNTVTKTYVTITEWDVRAPYTGSLSLSYKISSNANGEGIANFTSEQLTDANAGCGDFGGGIIRYAPGDKVLPGLPNDPTASEFFKTADKSTFAYVNGYYYSFKHDESLCSAVSVNASGPVASIQSQTNDAVKDVTSSLEAVPTSK